MTEESVDIQEVSDLRCAEDPPGFVFPEDTSGLLEEALLMGSTTTELRETMQATQEDVHGFSRLEQAFACSDRPRSNGGAGGDSASSESSQSDDDEVELPDSVGSIRRGHEIPLRPRRSRLSIIVADRRGKMVGEVFVADCNAISQDLVNDIAIKACKVTSSFINANGRVRFTWGQSGLIAGRPQARRQPLFGVATSGERQGLYCPSCIEHGGFCEDHEDQNPSHEGPEQSVGEANDAIDPHTWMVFVKLFGWRKDGAWCKLCKTACRFCGKHTNQDPAHQGLAASVEHELTKVHGYKKNGTPCKKCTGLDRQCHQHRDQNEVNDICYVVTAKHLLEARDDDTYTGSTLTCLGRAEQEVALREGGCAPVHDFLQERDIVTGPSVRFLQHGFASEDLHFQRASRTLELRLGDKVGICVWRDVDAILDAEEELVGPANQPCILTGQITRVLPNGDFLTDINCFKGCSGAVVFLLDRRQRRSLSPEHYGKAVGVHSAHYVEGNLAQRL